MALIQNGKIVLDPMMMRQYSMTLNMMTEEADKISESEHEETRKLKEFRSQLDAIEAYRAGLLKDFELFSCEGFEQVIYLKDDDTIQFLYREE